MRAGPTEAYAELRRVEALEPLTDAQIETLVSIVQLERFETDHVVYAEAAHGRDFLFVGSGELEARRLTPFGDQKVATLRGRDLVGEISLLDGKPRSASVVALSGGHLWRFDAGGLASLAANDPILEVALLRMFCRSLAGKIRQANEVMTQIMAPGKTAARYGEGTKGERSAIDEETKREILSEQGMSSAELQTLSTYVEAQSFASGDRLFVEGESGDTMYIVVDGQVRISRRIPDLGEEALAILGRGEVFGEMAWIDRSPRSADALAHTGGCTVLAISRQHLDEALEAGSDAGSRFLKTLCQLLCRRIRNMNDQLVAYRTIAWFG